LSDQPAGIGAYRMSELVRDTVGLIGHLGLERVTIVGHDWGALIGWWTTILAPKWVERLVTLSAPHPTCYATPRENASVYYPPYYHAQVATAQPGALFNGDRMTRRVTDPVARAELNDALQRSGIECLRNFYRANEAVPSARLAALAPVRVPVLSLYGENDPF